MTFDEDGERLDLMGSFYGTVYRNDDPENLGRVQVTIGAIADQPATGWMLPSPPSGLWTVPRVGDRVLVEFYRSNPDRGYYRGANWTRSTVPEESGGDPDVLVLQRDRYAIVIDDSAGRVTIRHRESGDAISLNANDLSISISATASVSISAGGEIALSAPAVTVNGTPLIPGLNQF